MGVLYMPFFKVADAGLGNITFTTAGKSDVTINMGTVTATAEDSSTSSIFSHFNHSDIKSFDEYETDRFVHYARAGFAVRLEQLIREGMTTATWDTPSNFNCDFSYTTGLVTLSYSTTFGVNWNSSAANSLMLGFALTLGDVPVNLSGASSYTGTKQPTYCINSTLTDVSWESGLYEPDGLGNHVIADNGAGSSLARTQAPQFNDWTQEFESNIKTYTIAAQTLMTSTWTHQDLYAQCRKGYPFVLYGDDRVGVNSGNAEVYSLRSDGMSFHPRRATPGSGTQFHIDYRCHLEGIAT